MNKKYISLGVLAATLIVWLIAPLYDAMIFEMNAFDLLGNLDICGLPDYLMLFAPLAAIVLGLLGIFKDAKFSKIGGFVGAGGMLLSVILNVTTTEQYTFDVLAWGVWALLILTVVNCVINLKAEN